MGIATIPCGKFLDEKTNSYTGKRPLIKEWEKFSFELPDEETINSWGKNAKNIWGVAIVTGPASNICCVDVDTEDPELQQRILAQLPYTPVVVLGKPGRLGKFIYRIAEYKEEIPENYSMTKLKILDPNKKSSSAVDFFFSKSYICIPPSLHSCDGNNANAIFYKWEKEPLTDIVLANLPVLEPVIIERVRMAVDGMTNNAIKDVLPGEVETDEISGRWQQIVHLASKLIADRTPFEAAVDTLLRFDLQNFPNNQYFLDKTKGAKTKNNRLNAYKFYADMLASVNSKKKLEKEFELPSIPIGVTYESETWPDIIPFKKRAVSMPFNPEWIPESMRDTITLASVATSVDPAMIFFYTLGAFSSCLGNKLIIQPYHMNKEYTEVPNLYVGLVAKSGDRKSEITKIAKKPLMAIQKEIKEKNKEIEQKARVYNENIEIRIDKIRNDIKKEIGENGIDSLLTTTLREEIAQMEAKKITTRNISLYEQENTLEAYYQIVEENSNGIFIEFNEWGTMHTYLSSGEGQRMRRFLLDAWDGQRPFSYKTKHNGNNTIDRLNLSVGFCSQEDVISHIFWRIFNIKKDNDGLLQRFMLVISDGIYRPTKDVAFYFPEEVIQIFRNAYEMPASKERALLDMDAYDYWMDFTEKNRQERIKMSNPVIESFYSKYDGMIVRIAANLAVIENNGKRIQDVKLHHIKTAHHLIEYLRASLLAIKSLSDYNSSIEISKLIETSVIQDGATTRELYRAHPNLFGSADMVIERLKPLHEHNYIRIERDKKSDYIKINPKVRENKK